MGVLEGGWGKIWGGVGGGCGVQGAVGLRMGCWGVSGGDMGGLGASGWIGRSCRYIWGHIGSWKGSRKGRGPKGGGHGVS